jgi:hypothetical protein
VGEIVWSTGSPVHPVAMKLGLSSFCETLVTPGTDHEVISNCFVFGVRAGK